MEKEQNLSVTGDKMLFPEMFPPEEEISVHERKSIK